MVRPMVHSTKHYVQSSLSTTTAGTVKTISIVQGVAVGAKNTAPEVEEGNSVKACYVEMWLRQNDTLPGSFVAILYKTSGDTNAPTAAEMASLNDWDGKKNILFTAMGLVNDQNNQAVPIMRSYYKIPKSKQRFGLGDDLKLSIFAQVLDLNTCGFFTYKEYS